MVFCIRIAAGARALDGVDALPRADGSCEASAGESGFYIGLREGGFDEDAPIGLIDGIIEVLEVAPCGPYKRRFYLFRRRACSSRSRRFRSICNFRT